ncbi:UNVERIFIED_CONTAM: Like-Sm ribonucleoprotein core [Euhalothece sp. KZN 001]
MTARPLDVLESALEESVTVTLKDDRSFYGLLLGYDQHMNAVLGQPEEPVDTVGIETVENTTIIRGDNIVMVRK